MCYGASQKTDRCSAPPMHTSITILLQQSVIFAHVPAMIVTGWLSCCNTSPFFSTLAHLAQIRYMAACLNGNYQPWHGCSKTNHVQACMPHVCHACALCQILHLLPPTPHPLLVFVHSIACSLKAVMYCCAETDAVVWRITASGPPCEPYHTAEQ